MKNIKNDLVVINYLKENNPVKSIKEDLIRYYEEHSCAKKEDIKSYLEETFTIGALLDMLGEKTPCEKKETEQCVSKVPVLNEIKSFKRNTMSNMSNKSIVYEQLENVDSIKSDDFVFTKVKPSLKNNDVLAVYTIGSKNDELVDLMYVELDGKFMDLKKQKGRIVKNYLQCLEKTPHSSVSYCKLNNFRRKNMCPVYNKVTEEVYESVNECAKANNIPIGTLAYQLKKKTGDFEYI